MQGAETPCSPAQEVEEGGRVGPGLEPGLAADGTLGPLVPAYACGSPPQACHFPCVTQAVSLIITRGRRSCKQVYDIHGLLRLYYILCACKQLLVALSEK